MKVILDFDEVNITNIRDVYMEALRVKQRLGRSYPITIRLPKEACDMLPKAPGNSNDLSKTFYSFPVEFK